MSGVIRNGSETFGLITRLLHWLTVALVVAALPLGLYIAAMPPRLDLIWLFGLHKTLGISVLILTVARLGWHRISPPPAPIDAGSPPWQMQLARVTHRSLYAVLILMPVSGWVASSATGIDTVVFRSVTLPRIAPVSETWEAVGFAVHGVCGAGLAGLVLLHVAGALHRAILRRDGSLRRIITGRARPHIGKASLGPR